MRLPTVHVLLMLLCTGVAAPAHAQEPAEEKVALTPEQLDLNNKAIQARTQDPPDVERAIRLVSAADLVGTPNKLIAMTHARARQLAGECHAAERSYDELSSLPGVQGVSTEQLMSRAEKYREELVDCFATVVLSCERPAETSVKLDGVDDARCGTAHRVDPGKSRVNAHQEAGFFGHAGRTCRDNDHAMSVDGTGERRQSRPPSIRRV